MGVGGGKTKNRVFPGLTKTNAANIVWAIVLSALVFFRFWLVSSQALNGAGDAPHDAGLFFRLAVELIIMSRVLSVMSSSTASASKEKFCASSKGIGMGVAPENLITDS